MDNKHEQQLFTRVAGLETDVQNIKEQISDLSNSIRTLVSTVQHANKTNWSVVASFLAVMLTVLAAVGYLSLEPIKERIERQRYNNIRQYDYMNDIRNDIRSLKIGQGRHEEKIKSNKEDLNKIYEEQQQVAPRTYKNKLLQ